MPSFMSFENEEEFAREYSRLVSRLVRPFFLKGGDRDDLYQEGMIGLLQAIRKYDPARSDNFEAFATLCIKSRLFDAVRQDAASGQRENKAAEQLVLAEQAYNRGALLDPEALCLANESAKEIQTDLSGLLSAFEASVLGPYLEGFTVNEIAARLGREAKSVDNAVARIRRKLAKYLDHSDNRPCSCSHKTLPPCGKER